MKKKTILLGYGNPDRGDDGAAWHILNRLFIFSGQNDVDLFSADITSLNKNIDVWFNFQLLPEYAEIISCYDQAIFIDAHTGEIKLDLSFMEIKGSIDYSPFTHHMTPATLIAITKSITGKSPKAWLLSVRGYNFQFDCTLSESTERLVDQAVKLLIQKYLQ